MNCPTVTVKAIKCPFPRTFFSSNTAFIGSWYVRTGDTFLPGDPLFDYVVPSLFGNSAVKHTVCSVESGVLISIRKNYAASPDNAALENEVIGTYIPLQEWNRFADLLDQHEQYVSDGYSDAIAQLKQLRSDCDVKRKDTKNRIAEISTLQQTLSDCRRETEEQLRIISERKIQKTAALDALYTAFDSLSLESLLTAVLNRFDELSKNTDPTVSNELRRLTFVLGSLLAERYRMPYQEYRLVRSELEAFRHIVHRFDEFERNLRSVLNNDDIPESERIKRRQNCFHDLSRFANTFFHQESHSDEAA